MPVPAIIGIGALLKSFFAAFILWVQKYSGIALRLLGVGLLFVAVTALLTLFFNEVKSLTATALAQAPPNIQGSLGLIGNFIPSNIAVCVSTIISTHIAGMVFQWLFYGANLKAKVLIGS